MNLLYRMNKYSSAQNIRPEKHFFFYQNHTCKKGTMKQKI